MEQPKLLQRYCVHCHNSETHEGGPCGNARTLPTFVNCGPEDCWRGQLGMANGVTGQENATGTDQSSVRATPLHALQSIGKITSRKKKTT